MEKRSDFNHKYTRRKHGHDYRKPGVYHLILHKSCEAPVFGVIAGDSRIAPGEAGCAHIQLSPLGNIIREEIISWPVYHNKLELYQYVVMPDHVHILVRVKEYLEKPLGCYVGGMKTGIHKRAILINDCDIFKENFTDKIIHPGRNLDDIFRYIRENPHRLAMRIQHQEFFTRLRTLTVGSFNCQAYGNLFLLRNPDKMQIIVHRKDTDAEFKELCQEAYEFAKEGGVIVSPFISKREKDLREMAESVDARIILIQNESFSERYKPTEHNFRLCESGRLLIIAPLKNQRFATSPEYKEISREECLQMNSLAAEICKGNFK